MLKSYGLQPELIYEGKDNSKAKILFFNGGEKCNFQSSFVDVSSDLRKEMIDKFYETPAIMWIKNN